MPAPELTSPDDDTFRLLDAYLRDLHAGKNPDRNKFLAEHPELASTLGCLEALDQLAPPVPSDPEATLAQVPFSTPSPLAPEVNAAAFGNFELLEEIGRGGMGVIWKARQKDLDRVVAIKMILANHLASRDQVERFVAEARTMAKLHHPNVVRIHETGQIAGQHYFVMEYIAGSSLADVARRRGMTPDEAARCVATVARAVHHLHTQGIVHRDLKPSNILLDEAGQPYVTDFGLVKMLAADSHTTTTGAILGTPAYMAPEQAAGRTTEVGPLSDVYSLGAILYDLLTGRPPFREENPLDTLVQVIEGEPTRPRWVNERVPAKLEMICLKCLEKAPEERYPSAAALADDLERYRNDEEVEARPPGPWSYVRRWARREPALAARLAALTVLLVIAQVNYFRSHGVALSLHIEVMVLIAVWGTASVIFQRGLSRQRWAFWLPYAWSTVDVGMVTALLVLTEAEIGPLLVGFPLLVAASGLWFRVPLVWFTTAVAGVAYLVLVACYYGRGAPYKDYHHHVIYLVGLTVLGGVMAYQVQRVRALSRYYEHRALP